MNASNLVLAFAIAIFIFSLPALVVMAVLMVSVVRDLVGAISVRPKVTTSPGGRTPGGVRQTEQANQQEETS